MIQSRSKDENLPEGCVIVEGAVRMFDPDDTVAYVEDLALEAIEQGATKYPGLSEREGYDATVAYLNGTASDPFACIAVSFEKIWIPSAYEQGVVRAFG